MARSHAHASGEAGVIVTIGDYVNKGPQTRQVIERLLPGIGGGWRFVALKGNHDAMMVEGLRDPAKLAFWLERGGDTALASYGGDPAAVPQAHIAWLDQLRLLHVDAHRLYVHAGVEAGIAAGGAERKNAVVETLPEGRFRAGSASSTSCTATTMIPKARCCIEGRTNLDTAAWKTGRLTVGVFDDDRPGGPVDLIVVQGSGRSLALWAAFGGLFQAAFSGLLGLPIRHVRRLRLRRTAAPLQAVMTKK